VTKGDLFDMLTKCASEYAPKAAESIHRNSHMNDVPIDLSLDQRVIDAVIVDYLNHIGVRQGIDLALYTKDLASTRAELKMEEL